MFLLCLLWFPDSWEHSSLWGVEYNCCYGLCVQEQSSRRKVDDLERLLRSSEARVAHLQDTIQQRDLELETLRSKVSNTWSLHVLLMIVMKVHSTIHSEQYACVPESAHVDIWHVHVTEGTRKLARKKSSFGSSTGFKPHLCCLWSGNVTIGLNHCVSEEWSVVWPKPSTS